MAFAQGIRREARQQFDQCMLETQRDREQCCFGGCGNIVGSCYDRQLAAVSAATEIDRLDSSLKAQLPLDGTWSGYEVQVETALLKHSVMSALVEECEGKR
jgi:hypothetical protein